MNNMQQSFTKMMRDTSKNNELPEQSDVYTKLRNLGVDVSMDQFKNNPKFFEQMLTEFAMKEAELIHKGGISLQKMMVFKKLPEGISLWELKSQI